MLTRHEELRVGVVVNVQLQTLRVLGLLQKGGEGLGLGGVAGADAAKVVGAGVGRGATGDVPLVRPVAVDVVAEAVAARGGLAVLAPHAVGRLRVLEACCGGVRWWMSKDEEGEDLPSTLTMGNR